VLGSRSIALDIHFILTEACTRCCSKFELYKCCSESFTAVAIMCCDFMSTEDCNVSPEVEDTRGKMKNVHCANRK